MTATFTATDNLSGFAPTGDPTMTGTNGSSGEGADVSVGSPAFTDRAGNTAAAGLAGHSFKIDKTPPTNVSVTGFSSGATFYTGGTLPTPGCSTPADALSDVVSSTGPIKTADTRNSNGVGSVTYQCTATDNAGNKAVDSKTFVVGYGGNPSILQPINPDGTSLFSRGRALPVKFQLAGDEYFGFITTNWKIQKVSVPCDSITESTPEDVGSVTPSTQFRYDSSADQYIYNADFRTQAVGTCWKVRVTLDDGSPSFDSAKFKLTK